MKKVSELYYFILKFFLKKTFSFWQRLGFHITPNHFYEPIPDTRDLKDELWTRRSELIGIEINEEKQIDLLFQFSSKFKNEYESFPRFRTPIPYQYYLNNGSFESVDGEILWCMIRYFKPKRIFEIGSGNSTYLMAQAILKNQEEGNECELTVFDPYPNKIVMAGFPGLSKLVRTKVQEVPLSTFKELKENDILFIDSTHVLKIGSDVQYLYLEVLPRLNKGVLIHIHDIFLPAEYPKEWILKECRFWTEQYILQAFLIFNDHFEVLWGGSYMHLNHPEKLEKAFSSYNRKSTWPGSFWIRKKL
jgi:predicted O-methyltransferase YrrM